MQKGFSVVNLHGTASGVIAVPVIGDNGHWWVGNDDTGVKAQGEDGATPHIGGNGNWFVGDADTGIQVQGPKGEPGQDADISRIETLEKEVEQLKKKNVIVTETINIPENSGVLSGKLFLTRNELFVLLQIECKLKGSISGYDVTSIYKLPDKYCPLIDQVFVMTNELSGKSTVCTLKTSGEICLCSWGVGFEPILSFRGFIAYN